MNDEHLSYPEFLFPAEKIFDGGKVVINALPRTPGGLSLKTSGRITFDEQRAMSEGGFEVGDDKRYALRNVKVDSDGNVVADVGNTTMGLYGRFYYAETEEQMKLLELAMPTGGCTVLITTETDGSEMMVIQDRHKNEYNGTPGASAGGIMTLRYGDDGLPKPIEEAYREHIAERMVAEVGLNTDEYELIISGFCTEIDPKDHHEIVSVTKTKLSFTQVNERNKQKNITRAIKTDLIAVPYTKEAIEILVTKLDCPVPPSHNGAFTAAGYMKILKDEGLKAAEIWLAGLQPGVVNKFGEIDEMVRINRTGDKYRPHETLANLKLPGIYEAFYKAGLLITADYLKTTEKPQKFTAGDVCVVGSVMFKDYGQEGTPDNLRGRQAIESLVNVAKTGGRAAVIVAPNTDPKFTEDLNRELEKLGEEKKQLVVLETEGQRGYSAARRQAVNLARKSFPGVKAIIMQEIEKDLTQAYDGFLKELSKDKILVMMNRGVNAPYAEYPWSDEDTFEDDNGHMGANLPGAQFWGERHQNLSMAGQETAAFGESRYWDRLNGTRVILNEQVNIGGVIINPTDLTLLEWEYTDGYTQEDRKNKMNAYSEAVYNLIPVLESMGGGDLIEQVQTKYWHSEKQREQEENDPNFRAKRLGHKVDLPRINFDVVCNILEWKKQGVWPQVLLEAIEGDKKMHVRHFTPEEYAIMEGEVVKRQTNG